VNNIVVGFDCGASHTRVAVWKAGVIVKNIDDIGGVNLDILKRSEATELIFPVVEKLSEYENGAWVIGMAGLDSKEEKHEAEEWFRRILVAGGVRFARLIVVSDVDLVLWAGSEKGVGIALIAGTGSNCVGRDAKGKEVKVGGMSHLLSDEGSGFALGWRCLRVITKMSDGRAVKTKLLKEVLELYKKKGVADLKNFLTKSPNIKSEIAKAAPLLVSAAQRGERLAEKGLLNEVYELALMVATVNRKLSPIHHLPVFLAGGLFENEYFRNLFESKLKATFFDQKVTLVMPLDGALHIARED